MGSRASLRKRLGRRQGARAGSEGPAVLPGRPSQPGFRTAVIADASVAAKYRGEHDEFTSALDGWVQAVRLACISDTFLAQVCYRAGVALRTRDVPLAPAILRHLAISTGQLNIGDDVVMEPGVYLPHGQSVIGGTTVIETGAVIRPFTTIGVDDEDEEQGPHIGARAMIGTGARVVGTVRVGAGAQVGANAVVVADVPAGDIAIGIPARNRSEAAPQS